MKLSFIVPIYNVKEYLRKCVDSLVAQDYEDYEIILVDDGSTDGSRLLADEIARRNEELGLRTEAGGQRRIRVIHQENRGLSGARNAGVMAAKGEYVCFVDSDDYWEPNVLGGLMKQIERNELDVLRFRWQNVREAKGGERLAISDKRLACSEEARENSREYEVFQPYKTDPYAMDDYSDSVTDGVEFLNTRFGTACYACMFILKRELLVSNDNDNHNDNCLFTEGIYFEDTDWTPRMLMRAKRIASTDRIVYNYLVREGSITNAVNRSKQKKVLEDKVRLVKALKRLAISERAKGREGETSWFERMIAVTMVSILGILATTFWTERETYIREIQALKIFPLLYNRVDELKARKIKLMNINLRLAIWLMHIRNKQ